MKAMILRILTLVILAMVVSAPGWAQCTLSLNPLTGKFDCIGGPSGPQGPPGANGAAGATGPQGPAGPEGSANSSLACTSAGSNTLTHNKNSIDVIVVAYTGTAPDEVGVNPKIPFKPTSATAGVIVFETADANRRCVVNASNGPGGVGGGAPAAHAASHESGGSDPLSNLAHGQVAAGSKQGNGSKFQMFGGGAVATNDCAKFDAAGNVVSAGAACGAGVGGGGDVSSIETSSTDGQLPLFNSTTGKSLKKGTFTGVLKATSGVPAVVTGTASDCVKVDGSSGACGSGVAPTWLTATVADVDVASLTTACESQRTTTVSGATVGWVAVVAPPADFPSNAFIPTPIISAPNTVKWNVCAIGTANPAIGTYTVWVIPPTL